MISDALGGPTSMSTEGGSMSKLKLNITMSIDGFVAGPDQSPEHPLGVGGEELHDWLVPLKAFREGHGEEGGEVNASTPFAEEDRKSTRLNSSHVRISYAVFCLKKKKTHTTTSA